MVHSRRHRVRSRREHTRISSMSKRSECDDVGVAESRGLFARYLSFLHANKWWWLPPLLIVLALIALLIVLSGSASDPFAYTLI